MNDRQWQKTLDYVKKRLAQIKKLNDAGVVFMKHDYVRRLNDDKMYRVIKVKGAEVRLLDIKMNHGVTVPIDELKLIGQPLFTE